MLPTMDDERIGPYFARRDLPDGREIIAVPSSYGNARVLLGRIGGDFIDDLW